ncbi:hypothetical protein SORBI_3001G432900 [Sorghum bicolor]|uniref:Uncharacterized protein n=1 Tax=Sorghum bicolor TaxID=4558 RepID=A0A1B6QP94_SORBI|nr:hypothetical protein SORBI_3001G432900 [Sorghum bicolor]
MNAKRRSKTMVTLAVTVPFSTRHCYGGQISLPAVPRRFPPKNTRTRKASRHHGRSAWSARPGASTRHGIT